MLKSIFHNLNFYAQKTAFCIQNTRYNYAELSQSIAAIQQKMKSHSAADKSIAILCYNNIETYASILAAIFLGKAFIPINPKYPKERINQIIEQAESSKFYSSKIEEEFLTAYGEENIINTAGERLDDEVVFYERNKDEFAYILFTSGSTGQPKGVPISYFALESFLDAFFDIYTDIDENDRFLQMFDLTFDLSLMSYLAPLCKGSSIYTTSETEIKYMSVYELLEEEEITFALMVPSILSYLKPFFDDIRLEKLRYSLFCGEAFPENLCLEWKDCVPNAKIYNVYGPTEATIFCSYYFCETQNKSYNGILSIGKAMKNMQLSIVNEEGDFLPAGDKGELLLSGYQLTPAYLKNELKNKESFLFKEVNGENIRFYRSGDLCFQDEDGDFMYCGRIDHQVKIDGYRVELGEIEEHVRSHFDMKNLVVLAFTNQIGNTQLHLFLEGFNGDLSEIKKHLKNTLPDYMQPTNITNLVELPLNNNGKIDRNKLKAELELENAN